MSSAGHDSLNLMKSNGALSSGRTKPPFLIGVAGGTASGKTSVCTKIMEQLDNEFQKQVSLICVDSFYRDLDPEESQLAQNGDFNFDHPNAFDFELLKETLCQVRNGESIVLPKYDFRQNRRIAEESTFVGSSEVVLVEGILVFYYPELRDMFGMKIFVDTDPDTRLARRVQRDLAERGRDLEHVLHQYMSLVKPAFEEFCLPTKKYADVIIPRGAENNVAIDLIVQHIQELLRSPRGTPAKEVVHKAGLNELEDQTPELRSRRRFKSDNTAVFRPH